MVAHAICPETHVFSFRALSAKRICQAHIVGPAGRRSCSVLLQVGHKAAVTVASFSPRMYKCNGQLATCLALGSQVWPLSQQRLLTTQPRCSVMPCHSLRTFVPRYAGQAIERVARQAAANLDWMSLLQERAPVPPAPTKSISNSICSQRRQRCCLTCSVAEVK
jgi:hypothetical protein